MADLFSAAARCVAAAEPAAKMAETQAAARAWREGALTLGEGEPAPMGDPGRPVRPHLVPPRELPRRSLHTKEGFAAFIHALAHIEFNAINLAWDAVYRFRGLPRAYYDDWVGVAHEEACHFGLLQERLEELGYAYGDFDAHGGLWDMARKTGHDPLARMVVIPRGMEARGLDVTPGMIEKIQGLGDTRTVEILEIILRDEIGHVAVGSRWFGFLCDQQGLDPVQTFKRITEDYLGRRGSGPLNHQARRQAGFSEEEMAYLDSGTGEVDGT